MIRKLPPLDMHAHIESGIDPRELEKLGAVVFAVTRSTTEYISTTSRSDPVTVWGLGCHPGVESALAAFDKSRFAEALATTPYVGEAGLDGGSSIPISRQIEVLDSILSLVARMPRIVSLHSKRATSQTLDAIERSGLRAVVLHWWLGTPVETGRALGLGCLFSVNRRMNLTRLRDAGVPLRSLLPETDHPAGNGVGRSPRQPGWTLDVERSLADTYGTTVEIVRQQFWQTLVGLIDADGVEALFPAVIRSMFDQVRGSQ